MNVIFYSTFGWSFIKKSPKLLKFLQCASDDIKKPLNSSDPVDVCLLVLEGGPGALETIRCTLKNGTPTVVFKVGAAYCRSKV